MNRALKDVKKGTNVSYDDGYAKRNKRKEKLIDK